LFVLRFKIFRRNRRNSIKSSNFSWVIQTWRGNAWKCLWSTTFISRQKVDSIRLTPSLRLSQNCTKSSLRSAREQNRWFKIVEHTVRKLTRFTSQLRCIFRCNRPIQLGKKGNTRMGRPSFAVCLSYSRRYLSTCVTLIILCLS
jgi:hypothetical protein